MSALRTATASITNATGRALLRRANAPVRGAPASTRARLTSVRPIAPRRFVSSVSASASASASAPAMASVSDFIDTFNADYARIHKAYEDNFWATKMNLEGNSTDALTASFNELEAFLGDQDTLAKTRALLAGSDATDAQRVVLSHIEKTLGCYIVESADAKKVREEAVALENKMNSARNKLALTYEEADGKVVDATPTVLRTKIRSAKDESVRKSCWEATRRVGPFLLDNGFPRIIAERNRFAKTLGFEDFYDMKVTQAEGFSKKTCFEMLDGLERATAPLLDAALAKLESEKGADARKPWNLSYALSGELTREMDPYFPFENAPEVWGRSFAAMGITYRDTKMRLDLCDRAGKYPNGFCHWPVAPHKGQDGEVERVRGEFHLARHAGRGRQREHRAHHADARRRTRRALRQHRTGLAALFAGARALLRVSRGDAVYVPRFSVRRRRLARSLRSRSRRHARAVGSLGAFHPREASVRGVSAARHDRGAVLREGAVRDARVGPHPREHRRGRGRHRA